MRPVRLRDRLNAGGIRRPMNALALYTVDVDWLFLRLVELAEFVVVKVKRTRTARKSRDREDIDRNSRYYIATGRVPYLISQLKDQAPSA